MADVDAGPVEQVFDTAKRQRDTYLHHQGKADYLRRRLETAKGETLGHPANLCATPCRSLELSPDRALYAGPASRAPLRQHVLRHQITGVVGGRPWNRTRRGSPRGSYSPLPHLAARRPPGGRVTKGAGGVKSGSRPVLMRFRLALRVQGGPVSAAVFLGLADENGREKAYLGGGQGTRRAA